MHDSSSAAPQPASSADLLAPPPRRSRRALWALAALALGLLTVYLVRSPPENLPPAYRTVALDRGSIEASVTATGTLSALVTVDVGSQVSGRVQALYADFNSAVKAGETIARIDPSLFAAAVERASANVAAADAHVRRAEVQAADARRQAQRAEELVGRGLIARSERDTTLATAEAAAADVIGARASVQQARASLREAEANLRYTDIVSPTDGVVISRSVNVGQTVAASLQAPVLFTIAQDLREMQVNTSVAEADIGRLRDGLAVAFTVDAYPGETFEGTVRQIRNAATVALNVVTYDAVIDVANPELKLKPGMTANVRFIIERRDEVLRVPASALRFRPAGQSAPAAGERDSALWVLRDGQAVHVPVRTGLSDGLHTEVVDPPIALGEAVITGPASDAAGDAREGSSRRFRVL